MKFKNEKKLVNIFLIVIILISICFNILTFKTNYEVNKIKTNKNIVMLTFDDGPGKEDEQIMDILKDYNAKATFFGTGINYEKYWTDAVINKLVKRMILEGHSLGNHSYYHIKYNYNLNKAYKEFYKTSQMIVEIYRDNDIEMNISNIPVRMPFLQYYRGLNSLQNKLNINYFVRGYLGCDYNEAVCGKKKILKQYTNNIRKGQILVCHTRNYATQWLPDLLQYLENKSYKTANFTLGDYYFGNYGRLIF
ncbi:polysaccharide deacetylase family protein [Spiroplasma diminutum]|nr:polysaccharide deacetylase family protein [Spiroplasma diminutum]